MILKEIHRFYLIIRIISIYKLYDLIPKNSFYYSIFCFINVICFWFPQVSSEYLIGKRLRLALQDLGPVWIKLGQMLSTRYDLLPVDIVKELVMLQDKVKPFNGNLAKIHIVASTKKPLENWCYDFQYEPIAAASISQVHAAKLKNGKKIVIKVIRPNILPIIKLDISLMYKLSLLFSYFVPSSKNFELEKIINEYEKIIMNELDLINEMVNAIQLRRNFKNSNILYIPKVYTNYCSKDVMVMERIYGISVNNFNKLKKNNFNMKLLAERGLKIFFTQVFRDGFFHGDMHPGNIFIFHKNPGKPKYISIDYGIVGHISNDDKIYLAENFIAFFNRDYHKIAKLHIESGLVSDKIRLEDFEQNIRNLCEPIFNKPFSKISFSTLLINLLRTAQKFNMRVQPQLFLLQKTLLYIEGLGKKLYPKLDLWKTAKPFLENWFKKELNIYKIIKNFRYRIPFYLNKLPKIIDIIFNSLQNNKIKENKFDEFLHKTDLNYNKRIKFQFFFITGIVLFISGILLKINNRYEEFLSPIFLLFGTISWFSSFLILYKDK